MTTSADAPSETDRSLPPLLSPRDESRLHLADTALHTAHSATNLVPVDPDAPAGALLSQALLLAQAASTAVAAAVIAERERGTTWEELATAAGTTKQSAHQRWNQAVKSWSSLGRSAAMGTENYSASNLARSLDGAFARIDPDGRTDAVSAGLDAVRHPHSTQAQEARRARARELHTRRKDLERDVTRNKEHWIKKPANRLEHLKRAATSTAAADLYEQLAAVYDALVTAEPELADEHRENADQRRSWAEINRKDTEYRLEDAATAPPAPAKWADGDVPSALSQPLPGSGWHPMDDAPRVLALEEDSES
ncbi:hypothetical protein ACIO3O_37670 [Streptomyces sp. NPDC087440]|uniref:hypothetical protein n=1 Tax=Streptomyces sp. NPDC087440 TaxID=3365790 RepID=UPI003823C492